MSNLHIAASDAGGNISKRTLGTGIPSESLIGPPAQTPANEDEAQRIWIRELQNFCPCCRPQNKRDFWNVLSSLVNVISIPVKGDST